MSIKAYPFKDDWNKYKGEKFLIAIQGLGPEYLVFGDHQQIVAYWSMFRNRYGKFR